MLEGQEAWGVNESKDATSYLVLTLKLRLNLVKYSNTKKNIFVSSMLSSPHMLSHLARFCLICGTSLEEGVVSPLEHILTSSCFVNTENKENGKTGLEVRLHPEPQETQRGGALDDVEWSDREESQSQEEDPLFNDNWTQRRDEKPAKKFMNDIARERHCCLECPAFFYSPASLEQHHR